MCPLDLTACSTAKLGTLLALPTILEILYVLALLALLTALRAPAVLGLTAMLVAAVQPAKHVVLRLSALGA